MSRGRQDILKVHSRGKPLAGDVDVEALAKITAGFSGADLENLVNEAAILAARRDKKSIGMSEMQEAMERVVMGPERRSRVITPEEKEKVAYHEAGHALLFHLLENSSPVHKITIVSRGRAGGYVMPLPEGDEMLITREKFEDDIVAAMGGRAAEEIIYNQFTTGASNDLQQATRMARAMVTEFGMSDLLGPRSYGNGSGAVFLGREDQRAARLQRALRAADRRRGQADPTSGLSAREGSAVGATRQDGRAGRDSDRAGDAERRRIRQDCGWSGGGTGVLICRQSTRCRGEPVARPFFVQQTNRLLILVNRPCERFYEPV